MNKLDMKVKTQLCLRHAWNNFKKYPGSKIMMGPGLGEDTRHFWIVKPDGSVLDTTPGYGTYQYYSQWVVFNIEKNKDLLNRLTLLTG